MAIDYVRNIISSGYNLAKINDNFVKIENALQDGLSRSGQGPNQMNADIDLNGYDLINVGAIDVTNFIFDGADFEDLIDQANAAATASQTSATNSAASASTATTQAGIATTQAGNASTSASQAAASAANAAATVQPTLSAAANKASPSDTDRIPILDAAASLALKYITIPNLVGAIFSVGRTIANAVFQASSFRLNNAGGFSPVFVPTALTANRNITLQDKAITIPDAPTYSAVITASTAAININSGIPSDAKRIVLIPELNNAADAQPLIQLGTGGVLETTGYIGSTTVSFTGASNSALSTSFLLSNLSRAGPYSGIIELTRQDPTSNKWICRSQISTGAGMGWSSGSKTLAGTLDRIQISSVAGTVAYSGTLGMIVERF